MEYYSLTGNTEHYNNWIFFYEPRGQHRVQMRESYMPLRCPCCGKFDEDAALRLPIEPDVRLRSQNDLVHTHDGLICFSERLCQIIRDHGINGLEFLPIPGDPRYQIALPKVFVPTDMAFKYDGERCTCCGRWRGIYGVPRIRSLAVPEDPMTIFASEVWLEDSRIRNTWFFVTAIVRQIIKGYKLKGVGYSKQGSTEYGALPPQKSDIPVSVPYQPEPAPKPRDDWHLAKHDETDEYGHTPLIDACSDENEPRVRELIAAGADVNAADRFGTTALDRVVRYACEDEWAAMNIVLCLLDHGANINAQNDDGETALMQAMYYGYRSLARLLLDRGADPNLRCTDGDTVLSSVERSPTTAKRRKRIIKMIEDAGGVR